MLNKSKNKVGRMGNKWVYALLMAFPVLHFCVFYVYVNANSIAMAFQNVDPVTGEITFTFANFADQFKFFTTGPALNMLRVSLLGYVIHLVVGLTTGLMFAYYVYKKRTMSSMFRVLMFLPSIIPAIVLVTIYRYFADNAFPEIIAGIVRHVGTGVHQQDGFHRAVAHRGGKNRRCNAVSGVLAYRVAYDVLYNQRVSGDGRCKHIYESDVSVFFLRLGASCGS